MIRTHAENIFAALNQLKESDGSRDPKLVTDLLQTAFDESKNLMDALTQDSGFEVKYKELLEVHNTQSSVLEEAINENKALKVDIDSLKGTIENYEESASEARTIRAELEEKNENLEREKEEFAKRCAEIEGKLNIANENNSPMQREIFRLLQKMETEMSRLTTKVGSTNKELNNNGRIIEDLGKSISNLIKTNEDVVEVTRVYNETIEDFREDVNNVHELFETVETAQEDLDKKFDDVIEEVEEINEVADNAKQEAAEAKEEADKCNSLFGKLKNLFGE